MTNDPLETYGPLTKDDPVISNDPLAVAIPEETLDPEDWTEVRALGHRMLDDMFEHLMGVRDGPVWRPVPDDISARLQEGPPLEPAGLDAAYRDFEQLVLPYPTGNTHPRFWGWVPGTGSAGGMLAELLASGINAVSGIFNDAPARVEAQVVDWFKEALGFPADASGVIVSGGSVANLIGLAVARDAKAGHDVRAEGLRQGEGPHGPLLVYSSVEVHSSVDKAVKLLGLGRDSLRIVGVDEQHRIRLDLLAEQIARDRAAGARPIAVVGNLGAVNTGALDDIDTLADLCQTEGLWLHLDGAFGAIAALSPELAPRVRGIGRADSLAFDFHKWLHTPYDAGCVLIRDAAEHRATFHSTAPYLATVPRGVGANADKTSGRSLQLSRGFKALKVWMSVKEHGLAKFGRLAHQNVLQAEYLGRLVEDAPELELLAPVTLNVVVFRYTAPDLPEELLDGLNQEILMRLHEDGTAVPSNTTVRDRFAIRVAITNHRSRAEDFELLVRAVIRLGRELGVEELRPV